MLHKYKPAPLRQHKVATVVSVLADEKIIKGQLFSSLLGSDFLL